MPAAGTLAARIRSEKAAPKADVFIGGSVEFHEPLATETMMRIGSPRSHFACQSARSASRGSNPGRGVWFRMPIQTP